MSEQLEFDFGVIWIRPLDELVKALRIVRQDGSHVMEIVGGALEES